MVVVCVHGRSDAIGRQGLWGACAWPVWWHTEAAPRARGVVVGGETCHSWWQAAAMCCCCWSCVVVMCVLGVAAAMGREGLW